MTMKTNTTHQTTHHKTHLLVGEIKDTDQDFEWYPTTVEILDAIKQDLEENGFDKYAENPSILDCGAGDGRSLLALTEGRRYAIEKSTPLLQAMDKSIYVVGTEFREQTLIDKKVDVIFCNPPYSEYSEWVVKILREANAKLLYFVIPERWVNDESIQSMLERREAKVTTLGGFDFLAADRQAQAKVNLLRIDMTYRWSSGPGQLKTDPFNLWFADNFHLEINNSESSKFDYGQTKKEQAGEKLRGELVAGSDLVTALEKLYQNDLQSLMANYKSLEELDPGLLRELDVNLEGLKAAIKQKIEGLKDLYWQELFDNLDKITSRLTHDTRKSMLDKLTAHTHVDFTISNAYAVLIWVIKNANSYLDSQLISTVLSMIDRANIYLYKSNQNTFRDEDWWYCRVP